MNSRIEHHVERVRRVLNQLASHHVPVYGIEISANHVRPVVRTGTGPYQWCCAAFGQDNKGHFADYVAHLGGVELHRRVRPRKNVRISE